MRNETLISSISNTDSCSKRCFFERMWLVNSLKLAHAVCTLQITCSPLQRRQEVPFRVKGHYLEQFDSLDMIDATRRADIYDCLRMYAYHSSSETGPEKKVYRCRARELMAGEVQGSEPWNEGMLGGRIAIHNSEYATMQGKSTRQYMRTLGTRHDFDYIEHESMAFTIFDLVTLSMCVVFGL